MEHQKGNLLEMFPSLDGEVIEAILAEKNGNYEETVESLIEMANPRAATQSEMLDKDANLAQELQDQLFAENLQMELSKEDEADSLEDLFDLSSLEEKASALGSKIKNGIRNIYHSLSGSKPKLDDQMASDVFMPINDDIETELKQENNGSSGGMPNK
jgi:flagellar motility protein MotE (MotC chaperone)